MKVNAKTAVVTGGASGIGAAIVRELAGRDCTVVIADYEQEKAETLAEELGSKASAIRFDAADTTSIAAMAEKAWEDTGGIDLVFANAGVMTGGPLLQSTPEQFDWIFSVNVRGVWATVKEFANRMIAEKRSGHLIATGSEHSVGMQHAGAGFYTGTKHALLGMMDVLRNELPETIKASILCPGMTSTELFDADRFQVVEPSPGAVKDISRKMMSRGMDAAEVARHTLREVENGSFLIVTHGVSYPPAEKRFEEIKAAFRKQAPLTPDAEKYSVPKVLAEVLSEGKS